MLLKNLIFIQNHVTIMSEDIGSTEHILMLFDININSISIRAKQPEHNFRAYHILKHLPCNHTSPLHKGVSFNETIFEIQ